MAFNNNATRLYVVKETTPGTLKSPSAGSEALALQPGFQMDPAISVEKNTELRAGIGPAKSIIGLELPNFSFSHYMRHSGVEGGLPDWDLLMESLFGSKSVNATERHTTGTASTTSVINLSAGGGDFALGKAVLVKNALYEIRPIDSVNTNALTLGFNLLNAPNVANINMGKCINYTPVNSGNPVLSFWLYRANSAAVEAMQGGLVDALDISLDVGTLLNMTFKAGGTKYFFDPIEITASTKFVDYTDGAGTAAIQMDVKIYRDPQELAATLLAKLKAASADTWTVVYTSHGANAGKFTITSNGTTTSLLWNTGANTANSAAAKFGFSTAADSTGSHTYTSTTAQSWIDLQTPALDNADPLVAKNMEILIGSASDYISPCVQTMKGSVALNVSNVKCIKSASGIESKVVKGRTSSFQLVVLLEQHEADLFDRFINNTTTKFCFNFGPKDNAGNWVPGFCGCIYAPNSSITGYKLQDSDGSVAYAFNIEPFMDANGNPEIFFNVL